MSLVDVEAKLPLNLECFLDYVSDVNISCGCHWRTDIADWKSDIIKVSQLCFLWQEFPKGLLKMQKDVEISEKFLNYGIRDMIT